MTIESTCRSASQRTAHAQIPDIVNAPVARAGAEENGNASKKDSMACEAGCCLLVAMMQSVSMVRVKTRPKKPTYQPLAGAGCDGQAQTSLP